MTPEERKAVVLRWIEEAWRRQNMDVIDELFATGYAVNEQVVGPEGVKRAVGWLRATFRDPALTVEDTIAEGDRVVLRWTLRGTHERPFMGVPPTGKRVTLTGINIYRVADGQIVSNHETVDVFGLLQQLGATGGGSLAD